MPDIIIVSESREDLDGCWECEFDYASTSGDAGTHTLYINDQVEEEDLEEVGRDWFRYHWEGEPLRSISLGSYSFEASEDGVEENKFGSIKTDAPFVSLNTIPLEREPDNEIADIFRSLEEAMNERGVNVIHGPQGWYTDPPLFLGYHYFDTREQAIMHHVIRFVRGM